MIWDTMEESRKLVKTSQTTQSSFSNKGMFSLLHQRDAVYFFFFFFHMGRKKQALITKKILLFSLCLLGDTSMTSRWGVLTMIMMSEDYDFSWRNKEKQQMNSYKINLCFHKNVFVNKKQEKKKAKEMWHI